MKVKEALKNNEIVEEAKKIATEDYNPLIEFANKDGKVISYTCPAAKVLEARRGYEYERVSLETIG